jgi:hypothetical protein
MNGYYDDYDDIGVEDFESDDAFPEFVEYDGEFDGERRGRRGRPGRRPPRGARGGGYNQPRPSNQYVTQTQLQAAVTKIGSDVKRLNDVDKTLNDRINANGARLDRHALAIRKEMAARKKADAELKNTLLLLAVAPLILKPTSQKIETTTINQDGIKKVNQPVEVLAPDTDSLKSLLPIALVLFGGQLGGLLTGLQGGGNSGASSSL